MNYLLISISFDIFNEIINNYHYLSFFNIIYFYFLFKLKYNYYKLNEIYLIFFLKHFKFLFKLY